jgi:hypothetical protein
MSRELLDKLFPDFDNHPANYRLIRDPETEMVKVYYVPEHLVFMFIDAGIERAQVIDYLVQNGVIIEEGEFGAL